jgi:hypothetical protein
MKLNVFERVTLAGILPSEGNFATLKILRVLKEDLSLTEEEFKEFEVVQEGNLLNWNAKGNEEREISIGEKATDIVVEALTKLDKENKLTMNLYSIYNKFLIDK